MPTLTGACDSCGDVHASPAYWGEYLCADCALAVGREYDAASWPAEPVDGGDIAVLDRNAWRQGWETHPARTFNATELVDAAHARGVRQVWLWGVDVNGLDADWQTRGKVDIARPAGPWLNATSGHHLQRQLTEFRDALGVAWKRSGAVTSDRLLYRLAGRRPWQVTEQPEGIRPNTEGQYTWTREPVGRELSARYLVSLDANAMFLAAAAEVTVPAGPVRRIVGDELARANADAAYWLIERQGLPSIDRLPHPLPGAGRTAWVTSRTLQLLRQVYGEAVRPVDGLTWDDRNPRLTRWAETLRDARSTLSGPARDAVKATYTEGLGWMGSGRRSIAPGSDVLAQPYARHAVMGEARCRLWRKLWRLPVEQRPVAISTDRVWWLTDEITPRHALRLGLPLGDGLGQWKCCPMASGPEGRRALGEGVRALEALDQ